LGEEDLEGNRMTLFRLLGAKPERIPRERYAEFFGDWAGEILGYALRAMVEGKEKNGPEILQDVVKHTQEIALDNIPTVMQVFNIKEEDVHERPFETYQKMFDFYDRCIGCKKIEWIREGSDSMVEIARKCWLMKAVRKYPEICEHIINAISTAVREKVLPDFEMELLEMVPTGNPADYCKVRVKLKK
jgi:hypothetical protein